MKPLTFAIFSLLFSIVVGAQDEVSAQDTTESAEAQEAVHAQLRELRDRMFAAYEERDLEALLQDVAPDVVITWQNADRNEGHAEFREFYDRMMKGDNRVVKDISSTFVVDDLSVLYGDDTAVARGTQADQFTLTDGSEFTLNSKWTATVVKQNDEWKVASFHVSANIFDNPILNSATDWLMKAGLGGAVTGLILGLILGRISKRTPSAE